MDLTHWIQIVGLIAGIAGLVIIVFWLRITHHALDKHREALEEANRINARAVETATKANRIARSANQQNREAFERQFQLAIYPHLRCEIVNANNKIKLAISNPGNMPAFDVSVLALAQYAHSETPLDSFLNTYVKQDAADKWMAARDLQFENVNTYGVVYERTYQQFPAFKKVDYPLNLPVLPRSVYVLLQYESMLGQHYVHLHLLGTLAPPVERVQAKYSVVYRKPQALEPGPRLEHFELDGRYVVLPEGNYVLHSLVNEHKIVSVEDGQERDVDVNNAEGLPEYLRDEHFLAALRLSLPARFLKREHAVSMDRDVWHDVTEKRSITLS